MPYVASLTTPQNTSHSLRCLADAEMLRIASHILCSCMRLPPLSNAPAPSSWAWTQLRSPRTPEPPQTRTLNLTRGALPTGIVPALRYC
jgi:hypothetical protein